jgi:hypothetical protein
MLVRLIFDIVGCTNIPTILVSFICYHETVLLYHQLQDCGIELLFYYLMFIYSSHFVIM